AVVDPLDGPQPVSVGRPVVEDPVDERVARGSVERPPEELRHPWIRIELRERLAIGVPPFAQDQPGRCQAGDRRTVHRRPPDQLGAARSRRGNTTSATTIAIAPTAASNSNAAASTIPLRMSRDAR